MALPPNQIEEYQGAPARRGALSTAMSYWLKEPYYMSRWTYMHRPSVWNAVGGPKGLTWHGLYGFKTLFAGAGGVSYTGGQRTMGPAARWILRGGGRGLQRLGTGFTSLSTIGSGANPIVRRTAPLAWHTASGLSRFSTGFQTGGVAGGIRGFGGARAEAAATWITRLFGGHQSSIGAFRFPAGAMSRGMIDSGYMSALQTTGLNFAQIRGVVRGAESAGGELAGIIGGRIRTQVGVGGLIRPNKYATRIVGGLTPAQQNLFKMSGRAGKSALRRGIVVRGGARLAAAGAVGMNLALLGGVMYNISMAGTRMLGDFAHNMRLNQRLPALEFGTGQLPVSMANTGALTERQRAVSAISASHLNARTVLGNEARTLSGGY